MIEGNSRQTIRRINWNVARLQQSGTPLLDIPSLVKETESMRTRCNVSATPLKHVPTANKYPSLYIPFSSRSTPRSTFCHEAGQLFTIDGEYNSTHEILLCAAGSCLPSTERAELRAAVSALQFAHTKGAPRGIGNNAHNLGAGLASEVVIAISSPYVVHGATDLVKAWEGNCWRDDTGTRVKNVDLWRELLGICREMAARRFDKVSFWLIDKDQNSIATKLATYAATLPARPAYGVPTLVAGSRSLNLAR